MWSLGIFSFFLNHNIYFFRLLMPRNMLIVSYVVTIWHPKSTISESICTPWNIGNVPSLLDWMLNKTALPCLPAELRVASKLSKFPDPTILQVNFKQICLNLSKLVKTFFKLKKGGLKVPGSIDFRGKFLVKFLKRFFYIGKF